MSCDICGRTYRGQGSAYFGAACSLGDACRADPSDAPTPVSPQSSPTETDDLTYRGGDWREVLYRNVTVSLEFAEHELGADAPNVERAAALVGEALAECRRLLATRRDG